MNNKKHSENKTEQDHANSAWAEIVDQWEQRALLGNGDETDSAIDNLTLAERVKLSPGLLDDLELDGQLRVLGKISDSQNSFVDTVVAQTHPESNLAKQSRSRLTVLKPSSASEYAEIGGEVISASSALDLRDSSSDTFSKNSNHRGSVALFASLAAALFIGLFLGSIWWIGSDPESAGFVASDEIVVNPDSANPILELSNDSQQEALEISSAGDADTKHFTTGEAFADQSNDQIPDDVSLTAVTEGIAENDLDQILDEIHDVNSNLVDANRDFDSAAESAVQELIPLGEKDNLENQSVESSSPDGPLWDSQLDWNLALQFHENGAGSVSLNGKPLQAVLLQDNTAFLLREISAQLQRRVGFLENRLGSKSQREYFG